MMMNNQKFREKIKKEIKKCIERNTNENTTTPKLSDQIRSDQVSHSVVSGSLQLHESQQARPPCPSPTPEFNQTHFHRVSDVIQPSHPLSSPSPPAPNPSKHQSFFQ